MFCFSFFNAEFEENGNNNNTSAIPVSMPSLLTTCYKIFVLGRLLIALALLLVFLWRQELGGQVGFKDEFPLEEMAEIAAVGVKGETGSRDCHL